MLDLKSFEFLSDEDNTLFYEGIADHYFIWADKSGFFTVRREILTDDGAESRFYDFYTLSECIAFIETCEEEA